MIYQWWDLSPLPIFASLEFCLLLQILIKSCKKFLLGPNVIYHFTCPKLTQYILIPSLKFWECMFSFPTHGAFLVRFSNPLWKCGSRAPYWYIQCLTIITHHHHHHHHFHHHHHHQWWFTTHITIIIICRELVTEEETSHCSNCLPRPRQSNWLTCLTSLLHNHISRYRGILENDIKRFWSKLFWAIRHCKNIGPWSWYWNILGRYDYERWIKKHLWIVEFILLSMIPSPANCAIKKFFCSMAFLD